MNIAVGVGSFVIHHPLGLALRTVSLGSVLSHNWHSNGRLIRKVIGVACTGTSRALCCELMDTRYGTREVASKRREIHCKVSVGYLQSNIYSLSKFSQ